MPDNEPNKAEEPPELTEEDEEILDEVWDKIGEQAPAKNDGRMTAAEFAEGIVRFNRRLDAVRFSMRPVN